MSVFKVKISTQETKAIKEEFNEYSFNKGSVSWQGAVRRSMSESK